MPPGEVVKVRVGVGVRVRVRVRVSSSSRVRVVDGPGLVLERVVVLVVPLETSAVPG